MLSEVIPPRALRLVMAVLPPRFREGKMPYVFFFVVFVVLVLLLFAYVSPYQHATLAHLALAATVAAQLVLVNYGMPLERGIHIAVAMGALQLVYSSLGSGGIFSPRIAWLLILPLMPFFVIGRRSGFRWLAVVLCLQAFVAVMTWNGWLRETLQITQEHALSSFITYSLVAAVLIMLPLIYDRLHEKTLQDSRARQLELEKTRQDLEHTLEMREHFIASVSHELRTPMNAILGFNALLLSQVKADTRAHQILEHTRQSADHLMTVINDVLDYSQIQSGQIAAHPETFALRETVQSAFDLFAPRVAETGLTYRCEVDETVPVWVLTDRHRLMQILVNLLGNAIKFTDKGYVILRVQWPDEGILFSVEDTGIGIAKPRQLNIFNRFTQGDDEIQKRYGGNGLGLAITQRLVDLLGGKISFESRLGEGSRFWFLLPLSPQLAPAKGDHDSAPALATTGLPWRFLVVDDHPVNRLLAKQVLKATWSGSEVIEARDGAQALELLNSQPFDLVLMDMVMPVMDGIEATRALRTQLPAPASDTPVMGLTANVNQVDLDAFKAAGLNGVLLKPFEPALLCAEVEALLTRRTVNAST